MGNVNVTKDATYRGRFQLDVSGVASLASDSYIKEKMLSELGNNGFADAMVWLESSELPSDWPQAARSSAGDRTAWVQGKWTKESGSYPGSGDRWKIIDVWMHIPAPGTCNLEGWTCYVMPCCEGFECKPDPDRKYGDPGPAFGDPPSRCFPKEGGPIVQVNPPEEKSNWGWWLLGLGVVGVAGYFAWPTIAGAFSGGRRTARANPAAVGQREALMDLYLWATRGNRVGNPYSKPEVRNAIRALGDPRGFNLPSKRPSGKVSGATYDLVVWATTGDRAGNPHAKEVVRKANSALGGDGFNLPGEGPQKNPAKAKTMYFRGAWLPSWPASGAKYEHGPIRTTYEEAKADVEKGVEWQQHPRGFVLNGRFADEGAARGGLRHNMFGNKPPRGVYEIDLYLF